MYPALRHYTAKKILSAYELIISVAGSNIFTLIGKDKLSLYPLLYEAINIASISKIYPKNFNNNSFKVNIFSTLLSSVKTKANISLILTTYII